MENKKKNPVASIILTLICILWMYPIVLILVNSLKKEVAITTSGVFSLPTAETWNGVANFVASVTQMAVLLYGSLVHCSCKRNIIQGFLLPLRIQYGSTVPDGYVHTGKNS